MPGAELSLQLNLPSTSPKPIEPPVAVLSCRGNVEVAAGATVFAAAILTFRVVIDELPANPPTTAPALEVVLPGEIPWPGLRVPWTTFPKLPPLSPALRLPGLSISLDPLPVRAGFQAISLGVNASGTCTVHIEQLAVSGIAGEIKGSFDLVFAAGGVTVQNVAIPAMASASTISYQAIGPGCFGFDWDKDAAGRWLALLSSELNDATTSANLQLRVHASGGQFNEIRLDWALPPATPPATLDLTLPGFSASMSGPKMVSLLARSGAETIDGSDAPGPSWSRRSINP